MLHKRILKKQMEFIMIIRQLKPHHFEILYKDLIKNAQAQPLDASYIVNIKVNKAEYALKVQPEHDCKIVALQALQVHRNDEDGPDFTLITRGNLLSSLLELLICQGVR